MHKPKHMLLRVIPNLKKWLKKIPAMGSNLKIAQNGQRLISKVVVQWPTKIFKWLGLVLGQGSNLCNEEFLYIPY